VFGFCQNAVLLSLPPALSPSVSRTCGVGHSEFIVEPSGALTPHDSLSLKDPLPQWLPFLSAGAFYACSRDSYSSPAFCLWIIFSLPSTLSLNQKPFRMQQISPRCLTSPPSPLPPVNPHGLHGEGFLVRIATRPFGFLRLSAGVLVTVSSDTKQLLKLDLLLPIPLRFPCSAIFFRFPP